MKKVLVMLILLYIVGCAQQNVFTDPRDGKKYTVTKIGDQTWMAENLNYEAEGQCYKSRDYPDDATNCKRYGRLYYWKIAKTACPIGWHLPTREEWESMLNSIGGKKTVDEEFFKVYEGIDEKLELKDGFAALLGGGFYIDYNDGDEDVTYASMGYIGCWFSASHGYSDGEFWWLAKKEGHGDSGIKLGLIAEVTEGCSVRCVKN